MSFRFNKSYPRQNTRRTSTPNSASMPAGGLRKRNRKGIAHVADPGSAAEFFPGDSPMSRAVREKDWSRTPLGPISTWPESIRTAVDIALSSEFQLMVMCGPELVSIYNDAYIPIIGDKHPWALGMRAAEVWAEAWDTIGPMLNAVVTTGAATRHDDLLLVLERRGFPEECYFTFSYSPVRVEGNAVGGVFVAVLETSDRVIDERRSRTLSELATTVSLGYGQRQDNTFDAIREVLSRNRHDIPFAALYLIDTEGDAADRVLCTGFDAETVSLTASVPLSACNDDAAGEHPVVAAVRTGEPRHVDAATLLHKTDRCGSWPEQPREALVLPIRVPGQSLPRGLLVVGVNPRRALDHKYREFFERVAGHIATAVANAEAAEAERRRAAAMAELDRAKSVFFSNASHELRTPVTLILGLLEEVLDNEGELSQATLRERLDVVRRNARRLHGLVNSIMDFTGIEAGRLLVRKEPTDLAELTREIASLFRSAIESAGITLSVKCDMPPERVMIDREMWEKILLNLLSNAFKFTLKGRIDVELRADEHTVHLAVRDTGIGIYPEDMPRIFDRFYRGRHPEGRSVEGSGVGLSLVSELVRLHGGCIDAESTPGSGTTLSVKIPLHIQDARPAEGAGLGWTASRAADDMRRTSLDEVWRMAPVTAAEGVASQEGQGILPAAVPKPESPAERVKVLVVDDNDDIVRYIRRLLSGAAIVLTARDGVTGLEAVHRYSPEVVLTDIMMPRMDGISLLRAIRADEATRTISVIVLSARDEENARLEALGSGADDYLVKPFNARELIARVHSHIQLRRIRRAAIEREGALMRRIAEVQSDLDRVLQRTSDAFFSLDRELRILSLNPASARLFNGGAQDLVGRFINEAVPAIGGSELEKALRQAVASSETVSLEYLHVQPRRWLKVSCYPTPSGVIVFGNDITERKEAEDVLRHAHAELEAMVAARTQELFDATRLLSAVFDRAPGGIAIANVDGRFIRANKAYQELVGYTESELLARSVQSLAHPEDYPKKSAQLAQLLSGKSDSFAMELRYLRSDGVTIWVNNFMSVIDDEEHRPRYLVKIAQDITDRKRAERVILSSREELRVLYDRLQVIREQERVMLAREVHDQLGQILSAAKIDIKLLEDDARSPGARLSRKKVATELRSASRTLDKAIQVVRDIATELRAPELEGQGLYAAIEWHARDFERRTRIKCGVTLARDVREPKGVIATALFRIFQEAMTNVLRHAQASEVWVSLQRRGRSVLLRVRDDGVGIARKHVRGERSLGITGMQERAAIVNGRLLVGPLQPRGTLVSAILPLAGESDTSGSPGGALPDRTEGGKK